MTPGLKRALFAAALLIAQPGHAAPVADKTWSLLAERLFPAITAWGRQNGTPRAAFPSLPDRQRRMAACGHVADCLIRAEIWSDAEIAAVAAMAQRVHGIAASATDDGIRAQIVRELRGINAVLKVYGLGTPTRYPKIDGPVAPANSPEFTAFVADAAALAEVAATDPATRFDPSVALALALLDVNDRDTAATFEPLDQRYNALARARVHTIDWRRYRYTAIIVTGIGPETPGSPLSPRGKLNVRMAASQIASGIAPFVILSGGGVHPRATPFIEALEMRKALIERYGVPADRIIVDPYARHTTTNLRNVTRRMAALGIPLNRDAMILTNPEQSAYIESDTFKARNRAELGYEPGKIGERLSPFGLVFRPGPESLRIDPADPLDP